MRPAALRYRPLGGTAAHTAPAPAPPAASGQRPAEPEAPAAQTDEYCPITPHGSLSYRAPHWWRETALL